MANDYGIMGADVFEFPFENKVERIDETEGDSDQKMNTVVKQMIEEAVNFRFDNLDDDQSKATEYYRGKLPDLPANEGRSSAVSTDVRDTVAAIMPSVMRIIFGPEDVVEYEPNGPEDEEAARQATDYINYIIRNDNKGFVTIYNAVKDALVRRTGWFKWYWEEKMKTESDRYTGLSEEQLLMFLSDPEVEVEIETLFDGEIPEYEVTITRKFDDGRLRVVGVPPEEVVFSPNAKSIEDARCLAHVRDVPASDLVAMGYDRDKVMEHAGDVSEVSEGDLEDSRRFDEGAGRMFREDVQQDQTRPVRFAEAYIYFDADDDGIAELRKFSCIGTHYEILEHEQVDERPFALLCPDPEPHTLVGQSSADYVMEIQKIKSAILRGMLDSLNLTLNPRTEVVNGEVNMKDMLNTEIGGLIRVNRPGMMREIVMPFVGKEAFPMLQYMDEKKENSTGISKAAAGLDADALQSSTKAAVAATLSAAQQHIEMIVRVFAETGLTDLYRGLLRAIHKHQDRPRVVRLRGHYVEVDPKAWDAGMDVKVNVALGAGTREERLQALGIISQEQKLLMQTGSPLVSPVEYRNTLKRFVEYTGFKNPDEFFKPWGPEEQMQADEAAKNAPPPPDPAQAQMQMLMQIEQLKIQSNQMLKQLEMDLKQQDMLLKQDLERDKAARDFELREREIEAKYQVEIEDRKLRADVQRERNEMDADVKREAARRQAEAASQGTE